MYPDFLGIGAQKAGTTWLHDNLSQHPQIWMPPVKELHYFDHRQPGLKKRLFGKPQQLRSAREHLRKQLTSIFSGGSLSDLSWAARYCLGTRDDDWYSSLFPNTNKLIKGEICPGYARIDSAGVARIHRHMPKAKIIYLLRNPMERAWSTAAMHYRKPGFGLIENTDIEDVKAHLSSEKTRRHDDYLENLKSWTSQFGEAQVFVGFFDALSDDSAAFFKSILDFLGADSSDVNIPKDVRAKSNAGKGERVPEEFMPFLADLHYDRAVALHRKFSNAYTKRWVEMAETYR